ncbi:MAG: DUF4430 domain-containing protein [Desulfobacterales bacterium]|nr:DUF4430 domain-containing protein [Desulfobacterales bacterium]
MHLSLYAASAVLPLAIVVFMIVYLIVRGRGQVILCTECQQCRSACPLLNKGCNPAKLMLAAKTGHEELFASAGGDLCVGCGRCEKACPRGLAPYLEVQKWRERTRAAQEKRGVPVCPGFSLLLVGLTLLLFVPSFAEAEPLAPDSPIIREALSYFKASQKEDGGFGEGGATEWVVMAIASAGQDPRNWHREGNTPLDYLRRAVVTQNPYYWIRMVLALTSMGENPRDFAGTDFIRMIKDRYREGQFEDPLSLRDDYWAVLALSSAREESSPEVQGSAAFILRSQNPDGSWGASTTGIESCADNTAVAICALLASGIQPNAEPIRRGISYLRTAQSEDGGFPYLFMPSNCASDSWAMQALWASGRDPSLWKGKYCSVSQHLLSLQQPDGSFRWTSGTANSEILMTAYAVPALLGKWHPLRLSLSDEVLVDVRAEGQRGTIFHTRVSMERETEVNPLSAFAEAAKKAGVDFRIEKQGDHIYLKSVAGESNGWQYRVNDFLPMEPADKYRVKSGAEIIWFYDFHGRKSPLRVIPERNSVWEGESVRVVVEQYDDPSGRWMAVDNGVLTAGDRTFTVNGGRAAVTFPRSGIFEVYAEKPEGIRSLRKRVVVEESRPVNVHLQVDCGGDPLYRGTVTFSGLSTSDVNGDWIEVKRPVLLGALEAARRQGILTYETIRTAEGLILLSVNDLSENNRDGSWWFRVNGENALLDVDEYEMKEGDKLQVYRSKHPMQN